MKKTSPGIQQGRHVLSDYLPVYITSLRIETDLDFDLYHFNGVDMVLFRAAFQPFTDKVRQTLIDRGVNRLYVSSSQRKIFQGYIQAHIHSILSDDTIDDFTKASIVYDSAKGLVTEIFNEPTRSENIRRSKEFVESTVMFVLQSENAFHNVLRVMSFDYSLYTHSVNVCTFSLALAHAAGIEKSTDLVELGTGALLHDIGKVKIPDTILYKPGPLNAHEIETVRKHPTWGVELISETDVVPAAAYIPIKQHHEREDGGGYPRRLKADDIHVYGKIVGIADAFDAMTTDRIYAHARSPFDTLKEMFSDAHGFDPQLLRTFTRLLGPEQTDAHI